MLRQLLGLKPSPNALIVQAIYGEIVAAARQPGFYAEWGVPDSPLGRFEMIALHMVLVLERLDGEDAARGIAQGLTDDFFTDVEHSLRELGIGDLGVPKRMKKLARMFYGRAAAYSAALRGRDAAALADALSRNVTPETGRLPGAERLAAYALAAMEGLNAQPSADLLMGRIEFPEASS